MLVVINYQFFKIVKKIQKQNCQNVDQVMFHHSDQMSQRSETF